MTERDLPGVIHLEDDNGDMVALKRIEPHVGVKSLGVITSIDGNECKQLERMHNFIIQWNTSLNDGKLPHALNFQAMNTRITRTLLYPLPATALNETECASLEAKLYRTSLPKCGISEKLPLAIRYASHRFMGLAVPRLHQHQGLNHLLEFVKHHLGTSLMAQQIQTSLELIHTIIGTRSWCFDYPSK